MTDNDQPDTAKQLNPVLMFDDKKRDQGPGVKDFRPISEFVEKNQGRSRISDEPPDPENPFGSPNIAPPKVTIGTESDDTIPPEEAPTPELTEPDEGAPTDDEDDDIPSPWDEPTSD